MPSHYKNVQRLRTFISGCNRPGKIYWYHLKCFFKLETLQLSSQALPIFYLIHECWDKDLPHYSSKQEIEKVYFSSLLSRAIHIFLREGIWAMSQVQADSLFSVGHIFVFSDHLFLSLLRNSLPSSLYRFTPSQAFMNLFVLCHWLPVAFFQMRRPLSG